MNQKFFVSNSGLLTNKKIVTMNVKLYLREYVNKNGKSPIYLVVTSQGKRIRQSLGIEVAPKDWDTQTSRVKKSDPDALELNLIIDNKIKKITEVRTQYHLSDRTLTLDKLSDELQNAAASSDFVAFMEKNIQNQIFKDGSLRKERSRLEKIKKFQNPIPFNQIDLRWIDKYKFFMASVCKNNPNTIDSNLKTIKKYLRLAKKYGIRFDLDLDDIKTSTHKSNRTNLTIEELNKLKNFYFSEYISERLKLPLGYFLFSCYTGLRLNEVKKLTRSTIGNIITFTSDKTSKTNTIPINKTALSFVENEPNLFVKWISDPKMNDYIREAVKFVGIRKKVSFHTARHTFATNYLRKGGKVEHLQKLLDHSDISTTMIYVHIVDKENIKDVFLLDD